MAIITINEELIENIYTAEFSDILNEVNKAEINFQADDFQKIKAKVEDVVTFETTVNSVIKTYIFNIENRMSTDDNKVKLVCIGIEEIAANTDVDLTKLTNATNTTTRAGNYVGVDSSLIYGDLVGHLSGWTLDLSNAVAVDTYRANDSDSVWNSISGLANLLGQEIDIDYINQKFIIADNLGTNQVDSINEKTDFQGVPQFTEQRAKGKRVIVYGKGDGVYQIKATATAAGYVLGDKTIKITDLNITSNDEAQNRADIELLKQKQNIEHYVIPLMKVGGSTGDILYNVSDTIIVNSPSVDLVDRELKIVKINYYVIGKDEAINVEVTNAEYSRALKSATQRAAEDKYNNRIGNTTNQGSGNTLTFGPAALNCKSTAPLRVNFNLPKNFIVDETDAVRVTSFTVDYDIDPFRSDVGSAELTADGDIDGITIDDSPPVIGETASEEIWTFLENDTGGGVVSSGYSEVLNTGAFDTDLYSMIMVQLTVTCTSSHIADEVLTWEIELDNAQQIVDFKTDFANTSYDNAFKISYLLRSTFSGSGDIKVNMKSSDSHDISASVNVYGIERNHTHAAGTSLDADNHGHDSGLPATGIYLDANSFNSDFVIGDDVTDAASVNSTSVDLYLDYWSGVAWINKHSILATGKTIDTDVDISNGGVYPDIWGLWSVRVVPNSASADLVIGSVNLKHSLDN